MAEYCPRVAQAHGPLTAALLTREAPVPNASNGPIADEQRSLCGTLNSAPRDAASRQFERYALVAIAARPA
jgi:hypothetical protein